MVDKENQWEDIEYSDNEEVDGVYDDDETMDDGYSDEEYDDSYDEDYEDGPRPSKKSNPLPLLILFLILVGAGVFIFMSKFGGGFGAKDEVASAPQSQDTSVEVSAPQAEQTVGADGENMGDYFFNEAGGNQEMMSVDFNENGQTNVTNSTENGEVVATVTEQPAGQENSLSPEDLFGQGELTDASSQENNAIMVSYNKPSRTNPFKPPVTISSNESSFAADDGTEFEIIEPPTSSVEDENLTRLLQTQISGILFDEISPSAIVNLNGLDQFVKVGDVISGYKIESITRDKVQISYKNNSYVASVGELFARGYLEKQQAVVNLENKFAGRKRENINN